jgi:hypothetical protein
VWKLFAGILDEVSEDGFVVVSNQNDFAKTGDFGDGF